jgi:hypothetical protein
MKSFEFEIYIQKTKPSDNSWKNFINTIFDYDRNFTIDIEFLGNDVNLYLYSNRDLSNLTTKILPFILKPIKPVRQDRVPHGSAYFFMLPSNKNLLEIKEHQEIKSRLTLTRVLWHFNSFLKVRTNTIELVFSDGSGGLKVAKEYLQSIPFNLLEKIDWSAAVKYKRKAIPTYLNIDNELKMFTHEESEGFLEVEGFPYVNEPCYLSLKGFDFEKHTLILGQTGVGKSKLITLLVKKMDELRLRDRYSIAVIDPHSAIFSDLNQVKGAANLDFIKSYCDLFVKGVDPKVATELTILLFKTMMADKFNPRLEQVLKYSSFALISAGEMSLGNLRKFLSELEFRKKILNGLSDDAISHFFDTDFIEAQAQFQDTAIMPITSLIDELNLLPAFKDGKSLKDLVNENFLTVFSVSKISLGDRAARLVAGLLVQQLFLIAQSGMLRKKLILIIDEVPAVENDAMLSILSESRKFGLSLFLSMQFLDQISPALQKAISSNVYNYFVFKTDEKNADTLSRNLYVNLPAEVIEAAKEKGDTKDDVKRRLFTNLNTRECIARVYSDGRYCNCFKARTLDA